MGAAAPARSLPRERAVIVLSVFLFALSCALPAIEFHTGGKNYPAGLPPEWEWIGFQSRSGAEMLFASVFGPLFLNFAGLANPLLCLSWILLWARRSRAAGWVATVALCFAFETFQMLWRPFYFDEAGAVLGYLRKPLIGWYLWIGGMVAVLIVGFTSRPPDTSGTSKDSVPRIPSSES